jgi:1-acyl-sn-glycerol-3-phosphate acyltransferase
MKEILNMGMHMCIYPEGTRNKTKEPLRQFHDGAFRLAVDSGKRVMPTVIFNTEKVMPIHKTFYFWPSKVEMHFLPPISTEGKTTEAVKEEVYQIMHNYYLQHKN